MKLLSRVVIAFSVACSTAIIYRLKRSKPEVFSISSGPDYRQIMYGEPTFTLLDGEEITVYNPEVRSESDPHKEYSEFFHITGHDDNGRSVEIFYAPMRDGLSTLTVL